jgi:predicted nucleic acid-binding protein
MILYVDTSALAKRYIREQGTDLVLDWLERADLVGTALVTRAEMASTLTRAVKAGRLPQGGVQNALGKFRDHWGYLQHISIDEALVARADALACEFGLRGYDAVHLACALVWGELLNALVTVATFDAELRDAAQKSGLEVLPE